MEKQSVWEGQCDEYPLDYYISYPCVWWEHRDYDIRDCTCVFLDRFDYPFRTGTGICFTSSSLQFTDLRFRYIYSRGCVKFVGKLGDIVYDEDHCGMLDISQTMTVKPFRKMLCLAEYFLKHTQPKLHALRSNSFILKSMHFSEIQRLSLVNATTKCLLLSSTGSSQLTDATLVNCMSGRTR